MLAVRPGMSKDGAVDLPVLVGGGIAALTVLFVLVFGLVLLAREVRQVKVYESTEGEITVSEVVAPDSRAPGSPGTHQSQARIEYTYEVAGTPYTGKGRTGLLEQSTDEAAVQALVDRYPVGRKVRVHFDPAAPGTSVLEPGFTVLSIALTAVGLLLLVIALLVYRAVSRGGAG